ncbi:hypothetical protein VBD025_14945 [Virgibacillus flavescens]|uniref:hypothetical protein n=1 Tax=Virgibacillus flavescens TaxID=1611422 RepID=UPI003D343B9E
MINRTVVALVGSFLVFAIGSFRLFTESLSSIPLFVSYVFFITGFIGLVANGLKLVKLKNT